MHPQRSTLPYDVPSHPLLRYVVGGAIGFCGVGLVFLLVWMLYRLGTLGDTPAFSVVVLVGAIAAVAAFCLRLGYRLLLNCPNRYHSLLSPLGWNLLGGTFAAVAMGFLAISIC